MTIEPFNQEELAAWIDEELGYEASWYELKPGELTAPVYYEYLRSSDASMTKRRATRRLEVLCDAGKMARRKELVDGHNTWVYSKAEG